MHYFIETLTIHSKMSQLYTAFAGGIVICGCASFFAKTIEEVRELKSQIDNITSQADNFRKEFSLQRYDKPAKNFTGAVWDDRDDKWINAEKTGVKASWKSYKNLWQLDKNGEHIYYNDYSWKVKTNFEGKLRQIVEENQINSDLKKCIREIIQEETRKAVPEQKPSGWWFW